MGTGTTERRITVPPDPGTPVDSDTPGVAAAAAAGIFGTLSRLRGTRIFHPDGVAYTGALRVTRRGRTGAPLFDEPGEHEAVFRFSRALGLPEPLPDILGLALRVLDAHGSGRHQDFLLATSADLPVLHHALLPGPRGFLAQSYSSVLTYRIGGARRLVGAQPVPTAAAKARGALPELIEVANRGDLRFRLALAAVAGRWDPVATLLVHERLPHADSEHLAFNPWNTGGAIRPAGPFMGIRQAAYRASQAARGLEAAEIP